MVDDVHHRGDSVSGLSAVATGRERCKDESLDEDAKEKEDFVVVFLTLSSLLSHPYPSSYFLASPTLNLPHLQ